MLPPETIRRLQGLVYAALQLMREGAKWELTIPSELAYGERGSPPKIPGGSVLVFELELIRVKEPSAFNVFGIDFSNPQTLLIAAMIALQANVFQSEIEASNVVPPIVAILVLPVFIVVFLKVRAHKGFDLRQTQFDAENGIVGPSLFMPDLPLG